MKYKTLDKIVTEYAKQVSDSAAHAGAWDDGGAGLWLVKLEVFRQSLFARFDLRPSEYAQIDDKEVEEPKEFRVPIEAYKLKMAREIVKNIDL